MADIRTRYLRRFEHRMVAAANEMDEQLLAADEQQEYAAQQGHLMDAAAIGQDALADLSEDQEFYDTYERAVRDHVRYEQGYNTIVRDPDVYEEFVRLEREIMNEGGLTPHLAHEVEKRFCHVLQHARTVKEVDALQQDVKELRTGLEALADTMGEQQARAQPRSGTKERLKAVCIALAGAALVGLNGGLITATVGLSGAASALSVTSGGVIIDQAVTKFAAAKQKSGGRGKSTLPSG